MQDAVIWGAIAAVLLCWAVGAYNRLVRLRAQALQAFGGLAVQLSRCIALAQSCVPGAGDADGASADGEAAPAPVVDFEDTASPWTSLHGAVSQYAASLAAAKARPLDAATMGALAAAQGVMAMTWQRMASLPGGEITERAQAEWRQLTTQVTYATDEFNQAVQRYNLAVSQFPALLLAWVFGLRRARPL